MSSTQTIKFVGFAPDLDPSTIGILTDMAACLPTSKGFFRPQPAFRANGASLGAAPYGAFAAKYLNGTIRTFAGTSNHLYELSGGSWREVDGGTVFAPSISIPGGAWRFTVFGNHCIVVDGVDAAQYAVNTGNFVALPGTPPIAKLVASVANNFVVMANTTNFTDQWWTCAQGDDATWNLDVSVQSTNGRLQDLPGPITALVPFGLNLNFALYKETATYLAQYVGPPVIWQFIPISPKVGALSQESIVDLGTVQVFPSFDDFYMFDGMQVQRLPNPVKVWFYNRLNLQAVRGGASNIIGMYDRIRDVAYWFYPTTTVALDSWIAWNVKSNLWAAGTQTITSACLPEVVNASAGSLPAPGVFKADNILYTIDGAANPSTYLTTGDLGDHAQMSNVTRLRPTWSTAPLSFDTTTVTGYTRLDLGATQELRSGPVPVAPSGWCNFRQSGRWHSFKISISADCELMGFDLIASPAGDR